MSYASIAGRAKVDPKNPCAFGVCGRCGIWYNLKDLVWQYEWRGNDLVNIQLRVCTLTCLDVPFQNNRPLYLPPDPPPVFQPRVETFAVDEAGPLVWDGSGEYWDSGTSWDETGPGANVGTNTL
jgi:hypothetical protein